MLNKILIANRGEIAVRIIRACRELGIKSVAVYSTADAEALHTQLADEAVCIGPESLDESYLSMERILSAAETVNADAIHPGYGFLSENSRFANLCEKCNINYIGPSGDIIEKMGDKAQARETMKQAGVPVVLGSDTFITDWREGKKQADIIGYPIMIKAALGGGGKGMRVVFEEAEFENNFIIAQNETLNAFMDNKMYIEKYVDKPKHIEIQILADMHKNIVYLGERDCSIQRKHQKVIEEAPSTAITKELRKEMGMTAIKAAKAADYVNAGTIEFLLDSNNNYYFIEMNTRIQVEHPVTEYMTGIDLIKEQIKIAMGERLSFTQEDIKFYGHTIECRINAENPDRNFMPCPGKINTLHLPGGNGIRVDTAVYAGYEIPPYYDSMIAKLIVHAGTRDEAVKRMKSALGETVIEGIDTNIDFLYQILCSKNYVDGKFTTHFIEDNFNS